MFQAVLLSDIGTARHRGCQAAEGLCADLALPGGAKLQRRMSWSHSTVNCLMMRCVVSLFAAWPTAELMMELAACRRAAMLLLDTAAIAHSAWCPHNADCVATQYNAGW